jgi:hypothetical protein
MPEMKDQAKRVCGSEYNAIAISKSSSVDSFAVNEDPVSLSLIMQMKTLFFIDYCCTTP